MIQYALKGDFTMLKTFKGGLHIHDYKEYTNQKPIKEIESAPLYIFPLQQLRDCTLLQGEKPHRFRL